VSASAVDRIRRPHRGVVVLLYHRVGGRSGLAVDLPHDLFDAQMAFLSAERHVTTLEDALGTLVAAAPPERDPIVVTFDDGTADFVDTALPVLDRYRVPAVLYLATDFVERGVPFPGGGTPLSWGALEDALSTGLLTVGSHTHTHALFDRLSVADVESELEQSVGLIRQRLGVATQHFAYPKAVLGSPVAEVVVRRRFRSAALAGTRPNRYGRTDPYRLARSPIQVHDGMRWFHHKAAGGMRLEDHLRQLLNRRRYTGTTT